MSDTTGHMGDRPKAADTATQSRWRSQPATVTTPEKSNLRRSKDPSQSSWIIALGIVDIVAGIIALGGPDLAAIGTVFVVAS